MTFFLCPNKHYPFATEMKKKDTQLILLINKEEIMCVAMVPLKGSTTKC